MNSVEQAVRAALAKGDAEDQSFRRRIYGSASAALERALSARSYTEDERTARRQSLIATVRLIESEFLIAVEEPQPVPQSKPVILPATDDQRTADVLDRLVSQPINIDRKPAEDRVATEARPVKIVERRKTRPWLKYAANAGILLALVLGGFWIFNEGKRIYAEATTSRPATQRPVLAETANQTDPAAANWIQVFAARDADLLSVTGAAKAEIVDRDGFNYVVMSGDGANQVAIKIGAGLMQNFAGKKVMFNLMARSINGSVIDTGAACDFGEGTKCDRKRFKVGPETAEYMFAVNVSSSARGDGQLLIAPDLTGKGSAIEVETIRATLVEPDAG